MRIRATLHGFTLIELAVVLVIIGLLVGGILVGQNLIRNAEVQGILNDISLYNEATANFVKKYEALPGDMTDAESYWGSDSACPNTASNTVGKKETCNGDGDGVIAGSVAPDYANEWFRYWQQLADAGMISGLYTGVKGSGGAIEGVPGINVPRSSLENAGFTVRYVSAITGWGFFDGTYSTHVMYFGAFVSGRPTQGAVMTPEETAALDAKVDDGLPATGSVRSYKKTAGYGGGCTTSDDETTATYDLTSTDRTCTLIFLMGF